MWKTTDMFKILKFRLPQNITLLGEIHTAGRARIIELMILVSGFKLKQRLK